MSDLSAAMVASGGRPFKKHDAERFILCKFRRAEFENDKNRQADN